MLNIEVYVFFPLYLDVTVWVQLKMERKKKNCGKTRCEQSGSQQNHFPWRTFMWHCLVNKQVQGTNNSNVWGLLVTYEPNISHNTKTNWLHVVKLWIWDLLHTLLSEVYFRRFLNRRVHWWRTFTHKCRLKLILTCCLEKCKATA